MSCANKIDEPWTGVPGYVGVDHIAIAVDDLDDAKKTYRDLLGLRISETHHLAARHLDTFFVSVGQTMLEIMAPTTHHSEISTFLTKRGPGVHHICLRVGTLAPAVAYLKAQGARLCPTADGSEISEGARGEKVAFIHPKTTHGVLIELLEQTSTPQRDGA